MPLDSTLESKFASYADAHRDRLVEIIRDLVRIPSENTPPSRSEEACQQYVAEFLRQQDLYQTFYELAEVPGLQEHPLYESGRSYERRPNLGARKKGHGGGRSLVLSGHIDTVPRGTQP
jgi:acetylornithine deacetylase